MRAVTSRKCCGSCRFFEASTVQGHGWCRNPDYEGRDDTVLLRAEELACRGGWQKDSWQAGGTHFVLEMVGATASIGEQAGTLPIGHGIGSLADTDAGVQAAKVALASAKNGTSAFPAGRRRTSQPGAASAMTSVAPSRQGQDAVAVADAPLQNHPELGANGEMLRRTPRSVVAEAHRKALERRESERELAELRRKEQQEVAMASLFPSAKPSVTNSTVTPRQPEAAAPLPTQPSIPTSSGGSVGGSAQVTAPRVAPLPSREPEDHQIIPATPAPPLELASTSLREELGGALPAATLPLADIAPAPSSRLPDPIQRVDSAPSEAVTLSGNSRYWDAPTTTPRFERMPRPEPSEPMLPRTAPPTATTQPVSNVGRMRPEPRPELELPVEAPVGRTIRPLPTLGATQPVDVDSVPKSPPARMPRPATPTEARPTEPALPTLPPRQIDEQLLKQLQQDWRERALAAHAGQRCGTCRYFQALDGAERGNCACTFAGSYRQAQERQDLGCINSFGTWWAANDDGWLQKTELGPRQPTPMVDQLLREWGIPDIPPSVVGPRRDAR
jgi:hypothetical protein